MRRLLASLFVLNQRLQRWPDNILRLTLLLRFLQLLIGLLLKQILLFLGGDRLSAGLLLGLPVLLFGLLAVYLPHLFDLRLVLLLFTLCVLALRPLRRHLTLLYLGRSLGGGEYGASCNREAVTSKHTIR